jgi:hypothetical protein
MTDASRAQDSGNSDRNGTLRGSDVAAPDDAPTVGAKYACPHCGGPIEVIVVLASFGTEN